MKKSIILIIATILIIMLTMYFTSTAASIELGSEKKFLYDIQSNSYTDKVNVFNDNDLNYYCAKQGIAMKSGTHTYTNVARVEIKGNTAKVITQGNTLGVLSEENVYNRALAILFYKIKDGQEEVEDYDVTVRYDTSKTYPYIANTARSN